MKASTAIAKVLEGRTAAGCGGLDQAMKEAMRQMVGGLPDPAGHVARVNRKGR
jgi:hypothetical protein